MADNSTFISYRRESGYAWARLVWDGLRDRSINAFLDLESMRSAGRFETRLLNQIAARPYFLVILTNGTLDRCVADDDWLRREIEHAIATERIIVPLFIAPFTPANFPADLPDHLSRALSGSNGATVYSQYLAAAFDKLADELLVPVAAPEYELTEEDARFQERAERRVAALPAPDLPPTPVPEPPRADPLQDGVSTAGVAESEDRGPRADLAALAGEMAAPVERTPGGPSSSDVRADGRPPTDDSDASGPVIEPRESESAHAVVVETASGAPSRRRAMVWGSVAILALLGGGLLVLAGTGGDGTADADPEPTAPTSPTTVPPDTTIRSTTVPTTTDPRRLDALPAGKFFEAGMAIFSDDRTHRLEMTTEGVLRMLTGDEVVWRLDKDDRQPSYVPRRGAVLIVQGRDGNLVIYPSTAETTGDDALWASGTRVDPSQAVGVALVIVDEGGQPVAALRSSDGTELWSANRDAGPSGATSTMAPDRTTVPPTTAVSTTSVSTTTTGSTTPPELANVTVGEAVADSEQAVVEVEFKNSGDVPGAIRSVEIEVLRASWTRVRVGQEPALSVYDIDVDGLAEGVQCLLSLGWPDIPPTSDTVETRSISFGGAFLDRPDADRFNFTMDLRLTLVVESSIDEPVERDVTVDVRADPSGGTGGRAGAACS